MIKKVITQVRVSNSEVTDIHEKLINTGAYKLEREPRSLQLTKDIIDVLNKHNLIDPEDDRINIEIKIQS